MILHSSTIHSVGSSDKHQLALSCRSAAETLSLPKEAVPKRTTREALPWKSKRSGGPALFAGGFGETLVGCPQVVSPAASRLGQRR